MDSQTVGQQLRQAREARSLTLEQVAQATRMRLHYLQAIEAGQFDALPSKAQARGFLRTYAGYLKLELEPLLTTLDGEQPAPVVNPTATPIQTSLLSDESPQTYLQADEIFKDVGQRLQHRRELLGLSLDDVVRHTHLRRHYLQALESGALSGLPSPVQGRGMLNNYATFLGMDPDPLLLRFADGLQARLAARQQAARLKEDEVTTEKSKEKTKSAPKPARVIPFPLRRLFSSDLWLGGALTIFLVAFVMWGAIRIFALRSDQRPTLTAPSIADVLLAPPTSTPTHTPLPPTPNRAVTALPGLIFETPTLENAGDMVETDETASVDEESQAAYDATAVPAGSTVIPESSTKVQVHISVRERTWMRVIVDDKIEQEGRVAPGSAYTFSGTSQVEILTGNGAALQVIYNDEDQGVLGVFGQVINLIYGLTGIYTPTPTVTPTPSATSRTTPTRASTATPAPGTAAVPALP